MRTWHISLLLCLTAQACTTASVSEGSLHNIHGYGQTIKVGRDAEVGEQAFRWSATVWARRISDDQVGLLVTAGSVLGNRESGFLLYLLCKVRTNQWSATCRTNEGSLQAWLLRHDEVAYPPIDLFGNLNNPIRITLEGKRVSPFDVSPEQWSALPSAFPLKGEITLSRGADRVDSLTTSLETEAVVPADQLWRASRMKDNRDRVERVPEMKSGRVRANQKVLEGLRPLPKPEPARVEIEFWLKTVLKTIWI